MGYTLAIRNIVIDVYVIERFSRRQLDDQPGAAVIRSFAALGRAQLQLKSSFFVRRSCWLQRLHHFAKWPGNYGHVVTYTLYPMQHPDLLAEKFALLIALDVAVELYQAPLD